MDHSMHDHGPMIRSISQPLFEAKGWLKLVGILSMIYGVLMALSIVGILIAWLPFWMGYLLYQSATLIETAHTSGDENVMRESLVKLKTYFTVTGVLALLGLAFVALSMALGMAGVFAGLSNL